VFYILKIIKLVLLNADESTHVRVWRPIEIHNSLISHYSCDTIGIIIVVGIYRYVRAAGCLRVLKVYSVVHC